MRGFVRPKAVVLPEEAFIPESNLISPPTRFTHELRTPQDFYWDGSKHDKSAGTLAAGTKVALIEQRGEHRCRVANARGLCVDVDCESLEPLRAGPRTRKR